MKYVSAMAARHLAWHRDIWRAPSSDFWRQARIITFLMLLSVLIQIVMWIAGCYFLYRNDAKILFEVWQCLEEGHSSEQPFCAKYVRKAPPTAAGS
jgi:hypothetical protein